MNPRRVGFLLIGVMIVFSAANFSWAQTRRFQMLAPGVGWALGGGKLYWTSDGGTDWKNITPPSPEPGARIAEVSFYDTREGWVVLSDLEAKSGEWKFEIAHTVDSGSTWSVVPLDYPELPSYERDAIAGPAGMSFADSLHGWIDMAFAGNSKPGKLLATDDGGRTWDWLGAPVIAGAVEFVSSQDGWVAGGPDSKLYVTRDGGRAWSEVILVPPPQVGNAGSPTFDLPVFVGDRRAFLVVNYSWSEDTPSKLVIYRTADLGMTWRHMLVLPEATATTVGEMVPYAITDSLVVLPTDSVPGEISVAGVSIGGVIPRGFAIRAGGAHGLSFSDVHHGWALTVEGKLLSSGDGGATWSDITPWRVAKHGRSSRAPRPSGQTGPPSTFPSTVQSAYAPAAGGGGGPTTHTSLHLGFDRSYVFTDGQMATWWSYSPYHDTSVYLPGSANRGVDSNLTSRWVSRVTGQG